MKRRQAVQYIGATMSSQLLSSRSLSAEANPLIQDIVILIPGIMGSTLKRGSETVWGVNADMLSNVLRSGSLDLANLRINSATANDPKIEASGLFETTTLIPGFWQLDGYTETRAALLSQLQLTFGKNYFEFSYDWRLDNRVSAKKFVSQAKAWLGEWQELSKNKNAKIVIVAHSMGGLIARYACEVLQAWTIVKDIFTLGTPYQGSVKALDRIVNGFVTQGLTQTLASFDSVYQLMPTYAVVQNNAGKLEEIYKHLPKVSGILDTNKYLGLCRAFNDECDSAAANNLIRFSQPSFQKTKLHIFQSPIHKTPCSIQIINDKFISKDTFGSSGSGGGDGTVPGFQYAKPKKTSLQILGTHYCDQMHGALQIYAPALTQIIQTLKGEVAESGTRGAYEISLQITDFALLGQPINIEISKPAPPTANETFFIEVYDVTSKLKVWDVALKDWRGQKTYTLQFTANAVGFYRVVVLALGGVVCSDLSCVASIN